MTGPAYETTAEFSIAYPSGRRVMPDQASKRLPCEHFWISTHEPGHLIYWVRICTLCNNPEWNDLDHQILELLKEKHMTLPVADYQATARSIVFEYMKSNLDNPYDADFTVDDVYVIWFCKTLQNWKALLADTALPEKRYYEVTFDGNENEAKIDSYLKTDTRTFMVSG